jgi:SRSO17 transposase
MDRSRSSGEARFARYVDDLTEVIGHADRAEPVRAYCTRMLLTLERKRVEPMAAATAPAQVLAKHQSLLHVVGLAPSPDEAVMAKVCDFVLPARAIWPDPSVDHRRHGISEEGQAFSWRGAAILRPTRQTGQVSDRGDAFDRE